MLYVIELHKTKVLTHTVSVCDRNEHISNIVPMILTLLDFVSTDENTSRNIQEYTNLPTRKLMDEQGHLYWQHRDQIRWFNNTLTGLISSSKETIAMFVFSTNAALYRSFLNQNLFVD